MRSGQLIVFEGPDGIGKSSVVRQIAERLKPSNRVVRRESFPGDRSGSLGALIYGLHHESRRHGVDDITPLALQALHIAAHLDSIETTILPALQAGEIMLLDRFWWSAWVYGTAAKANEAALELLIQAEQTVWRDRTPDAVFVMMRTQAFRAEHHQAQFDQYRELYQEISRREQGRYPVFAVENSNLDEMVDSIWEKIARLAP
jgi:dTMP kinase